MADPTVLTREQLLPVVVCLMRSQDAARHRILRPPLPPCPACGAAPTDVIDSVDPTLYRPARLHFRPCGHEFTASDEDILSVWDMARGLLNEQQNRPAGEKVHAPCPQVRSREQHEGHDWFAPVDGRAHCLGYDAGEEGHAEPAPPQTDAEKIRDLEHILHRVREVVGTDMTLVSCEEHTARIAALSTALRQVLAEFRFDTHPGRPCKQTGHISVETIRRWHAVLDGEAS